MIKKSKSSSEEIIVTKLNVLEEDMILIRKKHTIVNKCADWVGEGGRVF